MKKIYSLLAIASLAVACSPKAAEPITASGVVIDASMNTMSIITPEGDTLNISTMDADPALVPGVMLDDSISITYKDTTMSDVVVKQAISLEVLRHSPYFFIQGSWVEPNPIKTTENQGFTLNQDGTVAMINMATLNYTAWNLSTCGKMLTLSGQSIGNKQTIELNDSYTVDKLDADSLVLSNAGTVVFRLARQK